jgi:putative ABC transport system permease protein
MRPNFYMLFPPGMLDMFPATHISSFYLPPESKRVLNEMGRRFPTVSILEVDEIIARIEDIMGKVTLAIEMLMVLVIMASILVMMALVNASMTERIAQVAIVRALGGSRSVIVKTQWSEFFLLGMAAAGMAYLGAEILVNISMNVLFDSPASFHFATGMTLAAAGALLITLVGAAQVRQVLKTPPGRVLREM